MFLLLFKKVAKRTGSRSRAKVTVSSGKRTSWASVAPLEAATFELSAADPPLAPSAMTQHEAASQSNQAEEGSLFIWLMLR